MSFIGTAIEARYTDTNGIVKTAAYSTQFDSYAYERESYTDIRSAYGSILCPIVNTQIETGPLTLSLDGLEDDNWYLRHVFRSNNSHCVSDTNNNHHHRSGSNYILNNGNLDSLRDHGNGRSHNTTDWTTSPISLPDSAGFFANYPADIKEDFDFFKQ
jgi:hypothetical protein